MRALLISVAQLAAGLMLTASAAMLYAIARDEIQRARR